jgi:alkyl hydroperoxide reductase subunit F
MLDNDIKNQLVDYLNLLEGDIVFKVSTDDSDKGKEMADFLTEVAALSPRITLAEAELPRTPSFVVDRPDFTSGVTFAGVPLGHEFTSFVLALLQVSGRAPKVSDEAITAIRALEGTHHFETYVSLTCHNCPDVVQAFNVMSVLNPNITHTMIEGGTFTAEIEEKDIMGVPTVFHNGEYFMNGKTSLEEILDKLDAGVDTSTEEAKEVFDMLIIGAGPAGASAAIYAARKGIRTGLVADRIGGQVNDTLGIENFISMKYTEGPQLVQALENHVNDYDVAIMRARKAVNLTKKDLIEVTLDNGVTLTSKSAILATGARWRDINVPGEQKFQRKGISYCPHCDGPFYKGKRVAVIGGGNSGIEAAIDLSFVVEHVTVLEFADELKADQVLQDKLRARSNVTIITGAETREITGRDKVEGLNYIDRSTGEEVVLQVEGVFILIGLMPNTEWLADAVKRTTHGEIIIDDHGMTNVPGVFAAGDCTNTVYKQIIISLGSGATAALGAFDYLIRNT